jgi:hypothetical protein
LYRLLEVVARCEGQDWPRLRPSFQHSQQLQALKTTPEEVAIDYLRSHWQYAMEDICESCGDDWASIYVVESVLTIPARLRRIGHAGHLPEDNSWTERETGQPKSK